MPADEAVVRPIAGLTCGQVADGLGVLADGSGPVDRATRRHVEACLRCQADVAQYRRLLRGLRTLRQDVLEPAPGRLSEVLAGIEAAGEARAVRAVLQGRRAAYIGGIAAAATAGAAGVLVIAARNRRLRPTG